MTVFPPEVEVPIEVAIMVIVVEPEGKDMPVPEGRVGAGVIEAPLPIG